MYVDLTGIATKEMGIEKYEYIDEISEFEEIEVLV